MACGIFCWQFLNRLVFVGKSSETISNVCLRLNTYLEVGCFSFIVEIKFVVAKKKKKMAKNAKKHKLDFKRLTVCLTASLTKHAM